jgi:hypothetical protein
MFLLKGVLMAKQVELAATFGADRLACVMLADRTQVETPGDAPVSDLMKVTISYIPSIRMNRTVRPITAPQ